MGLCSSAPIIIMQMGDVAITTRSIPSILAVPIYTIVCLYLCWKHRTIGWADLVIVLAITALQLFVLETTTVDGQAAGLPGYALLGPFMIFLAGYAIWRLAGQKPLSAWPWPRVGLVVTLTLLLTDIGVAMLTPVEPGKVWQLGGACWRDALFVGPPFVMMVYYWLLDCRSPLVFCSQKCVKLGRCRFGMDGKACACDADMQNLRAKRPGV